MGHALARHVAIGLGLSDQVLITMNHLTGPYVFHFGGHLLERVIRALAPHLRTVPMLGGIALAGSLDAAMLTAWKGGIRVRLAWDEVVASSSQALGVGPYHGQLPPEVQRKACEELFPLAMVTEWVTQRQINTLASIGNRQEDFSRLIDEATFAV